MSQNFTLKSVNNESSKMPSALMTQNSSDSVGTMGREDQEDGLFLFK